MVIKLDAKFTIHHDAAVDEGILSAFVPNLTDSETPSHFRWPQAEISELQGKDACMMTQACNSRVTLKHGTLLMSFNRVTCEYHSTAIVLMLESMATMCQDYGVYGNFRTKQICRWPNDWNGRVTMEDCAFDNPRWPSSVTINIYSVINNSLLMQFNCIEAIDVDSGISMNTDHDQYGNFCTVHLYFCHNVASSEV